MNSVMPEIEDKNLTHSKSLFAIIGVLSLYCLYFVRLGGYPLADPDEPVYGQVAKEMARGGGWLTPHLNGHLWFDKPPLFYWLSGLSVNLFGVNEFACRLPSAVFALLLLLFVYLLAKHDFGRRTAVASVVVMATCMQQIILARAAVTDMVFVACLAGALYGYRRWVDACGRPRFGWAAFCGVMGGLAMLTKGPVAPLLLLVTICLHLWRTGRLARLASLDALLATVVLLLVGVPWYIAMYLMHGDAFVQGFLVANNITRFVKAEHADITGHWYSYLMNVPVLAAFFFPWSVFLPQSLLNKGRSDGTKLAAIWVAVVFVFFSISKTQLVTYIFPLYPAAAILVGDFLVRSASSKDVVARGVRVGLWFAAVISLLLAGVLLSAAGRKYPGAEHAAMGLGAILVLVMASGLVSVYTRRKSASFLGVVGTGMAVFTLYLMVVLMPFVSQQISTKSAAAKIGAIPNAKVVVYKAKLPSVLFYLGREPEDTSDAGYARKTLEEKVPAVVICKTADADRFDIPGSVRWMTFGRRTVVANNAAVSRR